MMTANQVPEETVTTKWSRLYASLYYFLGGAMLDAFGEAGKKALRQAIHNYGAYRASRVRADHRAQGLALNLANMMNHGDMPNTDSLERKDRICTPSYFRVTVTECTLYDAWQDLDGVDVGRIYCEEVHEPLYCGYAEGVTLHLPDFLTKGDEVCTFILTQPDAPEPAARPTPDSVPEAKIARLYGVLYYFLARAMLDAFRDTGERILRHALSEYTYCESRSLDEDHLARGWEIQGSALRPAKGYSTAVGQAVYDAWREMEGDETPIGLIYFEEVQTGVERPCS